ncbi:MAG TPA: mechanosensitive ion channel domain-containing protein [Candidatus Binataceae bacterium]|nr:mechanosensitive ion channel domain-containing protein [Candidatus Binataceae bacterium]
MPAHIDFSRIPHMVDSRWIIAVGVLAGWIIVLLTLKRIVLAIFLRITERPHLQHFNSLIDAIAPALTIAIIVSGIEVAAQAAPLPPVWRTDVSITLTAGIILALVIFADKISRVWLRREAARYQLFAEGYGIVTGAVRGLIFALGLLMFLESVGISIGPLLASLGIGSLAVALALQETVKNMFAGFFLIADKPLEVGDYVKLQSGQEGQLFKLGWRSSKFRMLTSEVVVVPNSQLIDSIVTNYRAADGDVAVSIDLAVLNSNSPPHVERAVMEVAQEVMASVTSDRAGFEPEVLFRGISGNLINLTVLIHTQRSDSIATIRSEFIKRALARFAREEIKLPA